MQLLYIDKHVLGAKLGNDFCVTQSDLMSGKGHTMP